MVLEEMLVITSEEATVNVTDYETGKLIGRYDGKDSIEKELNLRPVIKLYVKDNELYIETVNQRTY